MQCKAWFRAPVVLLLLALTAAPAFAAGKVPARSQEPRLVAWVWQLLGQIFPSLSKGRLTIDPNGASATEIDPNGDPATDGRWSLDPNG